MSFYFIELVFVKQRIAKDIKKTPPNGQVLVLALRGITSNVKEGNFVAVFYARV